jgi:hypothetical protein
MSLPSVALLTGIQSATNVTETPEAVVTQKAKVAGKMPPPPPPSVPILILFVH